MDQLVEMAYKRMVIEITSFPFFNQESYMIGISLSSSGSMCETALVH